MGISILASQNKAFGAQKLVHFPAIMRYDALWLEGLDQFADESNSDVSLIPSTTAQGSVNQATALALNTLISNANSYYNSIYPDKAKRQNIANNAEIKLTAGAWTSAYKSLRAARYAVLSKALDKETTFSVNNDYFGLKGFVALDADRFFIFYTRTSSSYYPYVRVGKFDANDNLTWGAEVNLASTNNDNVRDYNNLALIDTDKVIVLGRFGAGNNYGYVTVCTVSDVTITAGTPVQFTASTYSINKGDICKIGTNKAFIIYQDSNATNQMRGRACTVSGTVPTFGTEVNVGSAATFTQCYVQQDTTDKVLVVRYYIDKLWATVCTISGTTITAGTETEIPYYASSQQGLTNFLVYDTGKAIIFAHPSAPKNAILISWSGTTITIGNTKKISGLNINCHDRYRPHFIEEYTTNRIVLVGFQQANPIATAVGIVVDVTGDNIEIVHNGEESFMNTVVGMSGLRFGTDNTNCGIFIKCGTRCLFLCELQGVTRGNFYSAVWKSRQVEFYNNTTLIAADTQPVPFLKRTFIANSTLGGDHAYLKIKNTSSATIFEIQIYDFAFEVE